ncbi:hypothetical protein KC19_VG173100 [Ceratodon purpureus]|uniref:Secreted protein n=1 Tax=Ceratodon purpureus TaxID=3225 RepID=A0A8T0HRB0_CERPU|nr:hypothetical protein KC19_VG173100 [Ceratodon purpureus]
MLTIDVPVAASYLCLTTALWLGSAASKPALMQVLPNPNILQLILPRRRSFGCAGFSLASGATSLTPRPYTATINPPYVWCGTQSTIAALNTSTSPITSSVSIRRVAPSTSLTRPPTISSMTS